MRQHNQEVRQKVEDSLRQCDDHLERLHQRKIQLEEQLYRLFKQKINPQGADAVGVEGKTSSETYRISASSIEENVRKVNTLYNIEESIGLSIDLLSLEQDLQTTTTSLIRKTELEPQGKLRSLDECVDCFRIFCEAFKELSSKQHGRSRRVISPEFIKRMSSHIKEKCQLIRSEIHTVICILLNSYEEWPPAISISSKSNDRNAGNMGCFSKMKQDNIDLFSNLCWSLKLMCLLQTHFFRAIFDDGQKAQEKLWIVKPLLEAFYEKVCFHFGKSNSTFRQDKPEWLLKYGLVSAKVFNNEGKFISQVLDDTGFEKDYKISNELAYGVVDVLQQLLPQYLLIEDEQVDSMLLHVAKEVHDFDSGFYSIVHPHLKQCLQNKNPFSPLAVWGYGSLIGVLAKEEYVNQWLQAELTFVGDHLEAIFASKDPWREESMDDLLKDCIVNISHGIPICIQTSCVLLMEYIDYCRVIPDSDTREMVLEQIWGAIFTCIKKKLEWRVSSLDAYGDSAKKLAMDKICSCLVCSSFIEELLDACIFCPHLSSISAFQKSHQYFEKQVKAWSMKLLKLLLHSVDELVEEYVRKLCESTVHDFALSATPFGIFLEELTHTLEALQERLMPDTFRNIWTSLASALNSVLLNRGVMKIVAHPDASQRFLEDCNEIVQILEQFSARVKMYFSEVLEACDILCKSKEDVQVLYNLSHNIKESEVDQVMKSHNIKSITPVQFTTILSQLFSKH